ncbi:MAG: ChlI component of cobalt chelatase involved in B12 biosynthesis / ChlD component of cobalt chelatase involved in B12 biosynthesis, partial [uncultured Rubrobacteraceae bacterium]
DRALPLLRDRGTGRPEARPPPQRRLARGRRRAGARGEGDGEVDGGAGIGEAPAPDSGDRRMPV